MQLSFSRPKLSFVCLAARASCSALRTGSCKSEWAKKWKQHNKTQQQQQPVRAIQKHKTHTQRASWLYLAADAIGRLTSTFTSSYSTNQPTNWLAQSHWLINLINLGFAIRRRNRCCCCCCCKESVARCFRSCSPARAPLVTPPLSLCH